MVPQCYMLCPCVYSIHHYGQLSIMRPCFVLFCNSKKKIGTKFMLLLFSIRVAESPLVWERAVHSVNCAIMSFVNVYEFVCVLLSLFWF